MKCLQIEQLHKSYKYGVLPVLQGIDFDLSNGEICAIVGESGSGKSTFLKLIAGLEVADQGTISINGKAVSTRREFVPPEKRNIGFVFQDFALFPHLTVAKNVAFGLGRKRGAEARVQELLQLVGLEKHGEKYPNELSGGEQQRVALARAIAPNPSLLLLDEPFSNLDVSIKKEIRAFLFEIIRATKLSCVFVTHDLDDAMMYADSISILHKGRIEQKGSPEALYANPKSAYVAGFFGDLNVLCKKTLTRFNLSIPGNRACGVRACKINCSDSTDSKSVSVQVIGKVYMGDHDKVAVKTQDGCRLELEMPAGKSSEADELFVSIDQSDVLLFD
ncbi:MAG: ABC transporter ATP-binding protein [Rhodothermales bacterium]